MVNFLFFKKFEAEFHNCQFLKWWPHLHTVYRYVGCVQQSVLVEYCTFVYNIVFKEKCC